MFTHLSIRGGGMLRNINQLDTFPLFLSGTRSSSLLSNNENKRMKKKIVAPSTGNKRVAGHEEDYMRLYVVQQVSSIGSESQLTAEGFNHSEADLYSSNC